MNKKEVQRVPLNLTLLPEDKKYIKLYALQHDTTVSALIEELIQRLRKGEEPNDA